MQAAVAIVVLLHYPPIFQCHIYGNDLFTHVAGITIATYLSAMTELLAVSPASYGANIQKSMLITTLQLSLWEKNNHP